jgi:hypothetical protein
VDELLGGDLMEHNILHSHIGVSETLEVLSNFHDIQPSEQSAHPHTKYFKKWFPSGEEGGAVTAAGEEELEGLALLLGVEAVTREDLVRFQRSLRDVEPRKTEGFGFGKVHSHLAKKME